MKRLVILFLSIVISLSFVSAVELCNGHIMLTPCENNLYPSEERCNGYTLYENAGVDAQGRIINKYYQCGYDSLSNKCTKLDECSIGPRDCQGVCESSAEQVKIIYPATDIPSVEGRCLLKGETIPDSEIKYIGISGFNNFWYPDSFPSYGYCSGCKGSPDWNGDNYCKTQGKDYCLCVAEQCLQQVCDSGFLGTGLFKSCEMVDVCVVNNPPITNVAPAAADLGIVYGSAANGFTFQKVQVDVKKGTIIGAGINEEKARKNPLFTYYDNEKEDKDKDNFEDIKVYLGKNEGEVNEENLGISFKELKDSVLPFSTRFPLNLQDSHGEKATYEAQAMFCPYVDKKTYSSEWVVQFGDKATCNDGTIMDATQIDVMGGIKKYVDASDLCKSHGGLKYFGVFSKDKYNQIDDIAITMSNKVNVDLSVKPNCDFPKAMIETYVNLDWDGVLTSTLADKGYKQFEEVLGQMINLANTYYRSSLSLADINKVICPRNFYNFDNVFDDDVSIVENGKKITVSPQTYGRDCVSSPSQTLVFYKKGNTVLSSSSGSEKWNSGGIRKTSVKIEIYKDLSKKYSGDDIGTIKIIDSRKINGQDSPNSVESEISREGASVLIAQFLGNNMLESQKQALASTGIDYVLGSYKPLAIPYTKVNNGISFGEVISLMRTQDLCCGDYSDINSKFKLTSDRLKKFGQGYFDVRTIISNIKYSLNTFGN